MKTIETKPIISFYYVQVPNIETWEILERMKTHPYLKPQHTYPGDVPEYGLRVFICENNDPAHSGKVTFTVMHQSPQATVLVKLPSDTSVHLPDVFDALYDVLKQCL